MGAEYQHWRNVDWCAIRTLFAVPYKRQPVVLLVRWQEGRNGFGHAYTGRRRGSGQALRGLCTSDHYCRGAAVLLLLTSATLALVARAKLRVLLAFETYQYIDR